MLEEKENKIDTTFFSKNSNQMCPKAPSSSLLLGSVWGFIGGSFGGLFGAHVLPKIVPQSSIIFLILLGMFGSSLGSFRVFWGSFGVLFGGLFVGLFGVCHGLKSIIFCPRLCPKDHHLPHQNRPMTQLWTLSE